MTRSSSAIFTPLQLGPITLRNRTIRAAAFEGMCPLGRPSPSLLRYHHSVAAGGVGMTTVAYASVTPTGRTFSHQLIMCQEVVPALRELTDAVHREGAAASIQLGHCGNMADRQVNGCRSMSASAVFTLFGLTRPRAMTAEDMDALVQAFAESVRLAAEAGFDAVEIQAGHGYLLSQFISPFSNRRTDAYGGSLENRARLACRVVTAAREAAAGKLAVLVKTNLQDGFDGGMGIQEGVEVARLLEQAGADALVLSGGFVSKTPMYVLRGEIPLKEMVAAQSAVTRKLGLVLFGRVVVKAFPYADAYFLDDALEVLGQVKLPLVLVGGLKNQPTMEDVLARGFQGLGMARALIREPDFVNRLKTGQASTSPCEPCNKCMASMYYAEAICPDREGA